MLLLFFACAAPEKSDSSPPETDADTDTDADSDTDTDTDSDTDTDTDADADTDTDTDTDTQSVSCTDGADDDGDGWIDADDPDCAVGDAEAGYGADACNDGTDNDGDGLADADDPECTAATVSTEEAPEGLVGTYDLAGATIDVHGDTIYDTVAQRLGSWGDLDGDGRDDLAVLRNDDSAWFVFPGPLSGSTVVTDAPTRISARATAGAAGDVDGDGTTDLVLGRMGSAVYVYAGPLLAAEYTDADATIAVSGDTYEFAYAVDAGADLTGDGAADLVVGSPTSASNAGAAYVFAGPLSAGSVDYASATTTLVGDDASGAVGTNVTALGDLDGDGATDLAVGAYLVSDANPTDGQVSLWFGPLPGGTVSTGAADFYVHGEAANDELGVNVAPVGDFDGDGFDDVLLSPLYQSTAGYYAGAAYLVRGGPGLAGDRAADDAEYVWRGEAFQDFAGAAVAAAGDIDGDGLADVLIGAYASSRAGAGAGTAYLVYGGLTAGSWDLGTADAIFEGAEAGDGAGYSVAGGHDLDGAGFDDVVIGAFRAGGSGSNAGAAYVYGGGTR